MYDVEDMRLKAAALWEGAVKGQQKGPRDSKKEFCGLRFSIIPNYFSNFNTLVAMCKERNIPVQTIKSMARGLWGNTERSHVT